MRFFFILLVSFSLWASTDPGDEDVAHQLLGLKHGTYHAAVDEVQPDSNPCNRRTKQQAQQTPKNPLRSELVRFWSRVLPQITHGDNDNLELWNAHAFTLAHIHEKNLFAMMRRCKSALSCDSYMKCISLDHQNKIRSLWNALRRITNFQKNDNLFLGKVLSKMRKDQGDPTQNDWGCFILAQEKSCFLSPLQMHNALERALKMPPLLIGATREERSALEGIKHIFMDAHKARSTRP